MTYIQFADPKPPRIANRDAHHYTAEKQEFRGSNLYGVWYRTDVYVVYSYGEHWPLYVWLDRPQMWLGNDSGYSRSTGRHASQALPCRPDQIEWAGIQDLEHVLRFWSYTEAEAA